jgi:hypothetical protein
LEVGPALAVKAVTTKNSNTQKNQNNKNNTNNENKTKRKNVVIKKSHFKQVLDQCTKAGR